jgi:hypothetical protein
MGADEIHNIVTPNLHHATTPGQVLSSVHQNLADYLLCGIRKTAVEHEVISRRSQYQHNNKHADHG